MSARAQSNASAHRSTKVNDNFRGAQALALLPKRPMADPLLAIGERAASPQSRPRLAACPPCPPTGRAGLAWPERDLASEPVDVPHRHRGMAVAYALLSERERIYSHRWT